MTERQDRRERQEHKQARQVRRAARAQQDGQTQEQRQQARMKRRAERAQEVAANARPAGAKPAIKPGKMRKGAGGARAGGKAPEQGMQTYLDTMVIVRGNAARRDYPDRLHDNCREGAVFPNFTPKFKLHLGPGATVFSIGSGFSRDLEPVLAARGVTLPTIAIAIPQSDLVRTENPLNEYTPATIAQRINCAFKVKPIPKGTIMDAGQLFSDQLLPGQFTDTMEILEARRAEIAAIYARLPQCSAVIITLASAETWYDKRSKRFFNRPPRTPNVRSRVAHIYFGVQDVDDVVAILNKPLTALGAAGIKVVLTVSPVPQRTTYSAADAVIANEISKAVLRVAADRLTRKFGHVDYFPAYEIARSAGLQAYLDDNVQIHEEFAALLAGEFVKAYASK